MAAKSTKNSKKKANKPAKKAVKTLVKKTSNKANIANNKKTKKAKSKISKTNKLKIKTSSKKTSTKAKLKHKHKSKVVRVVKSKANKSHGAVANKKTVINQFADNIGAGLASEHDLELDNEAEEEAEAVGISHFSENPHLQADNLLSGPAGKFKPYQIHATEEYMNEQQLNHFTKILNDWKQELMMEVDHTISEMKEADVLADLNDRATQEEAFNLELRARDRERKLIKKIEMALNKIKQHEYGYCDTCGIEIGVRRLEARPTATLCIECKTLAEIREKRV